MSERSKIFLGISRGAIIYLKPPPDSLKFPTLVARFCDVPCLVNCALDFHSFINIL